MPPNEEVRLAKINRLKFEHIPYFAKMPVPPPFLMPPVTINDEE